MIMMIVPPGLRIGVKSSLADSEGALNAQVPPLAVPGLSGTAEPRNALRLPFDSEPVSQWGLDSDFKLDPRYLSPAVSSGCELKCEPPATLKKRPASLKLE
jgi:hypothetical protein